jgi:hypothetical protein
MVKKIVGKLRKIKRLEKKEEGLKNNCTIMTDIIYHYRTLIVSNMSNDGNFNLLLSSVIPLHMMRFHCFHNYIPRSYYRIIIIITIF